MGRKKKTLINIVTAFTSQLLVAFISLFTTRIIKQQLGFEYLGINGIFANIISFLSLTELGIGNTILFALYKPLAEDNKTEIISIIQFLKKAYTIIGSIVLTAGLCIIPFLQIIVKTTLPFGYIISVYLIFLSNTVFSYFLTYRFLIVGADQKNYVMTLYYLVFTYIIKISQLIVFITTKSYILFLLVDFFFGLVRTFVINRRVNKMFPYLKTKEKYPLTKEIKTMLVTKIKAMFFHSFGGYIVNSTDNILIALLISVSDVGKYAGYLSVSNLVMNLTGHIFDSTTPSIGNFISTESKEAQYELFKKMNFITRIFYFFVPVCTAVLMEPFVALWLGEDALLSRVIVYCMGIHMFLTISRKPILNFKNAAGLFEHDKFAPVIEGALNLIISIVLGKIIGLPGIILGTIISFVLVPMWIQPKMVFKYLFQKSPVPYLLRLLADFFLLIIIYFAVYYVQNLVMIDNKLICFIVKLLITVSLTLLLVYIFNFKKINDVVKKYINKFKLNKSQ